MLELEILTIFSISQSVNPDRRAGSSRGQLVSAWPLYTASQETSQGQTLLFVSLSPHNGSLVLFVWVGIYLVKYFFIFLCSHMTWPMICKFNSVGGGSGKACVSNLSQKETRDKLDLNLPSSFLPASNVNERIVERAASTLKPWGKLQNKTKQNKSWQWNWTPEPTSDYLFPDNLLWKRNKSLFIYTTVAQVLHYL